MSTLTPNRGTGNMVVDMIYDAVKFYKKQGRHISVVTLSRTRWKIFKNFMQKQEGSGLVNLDDGVQFNDILVRRGSIFMLDHVKFEFKVNGGQSIPLRKA